MLSAVTEDSDQLGLHRCSQIKNSMAGSSQNEKQVAAWQPPDVYSM